MTYATLPASIESLCGLIYSYDTAIDQLDPAVLRELCEKYTFSFDHNEEIAAKDNYHIAFAIVCDMRDDMVHDSADILRLEAILNRAYDNDLSACNEDCGGISGIRNAKDLIFSIYTFDACVDDEECDGADIWRAMVACGYVSQEAIDDMPV